MKRFTFKGVLDNFRQSVSQPTKSEQPELIETLKAEHCQLARTARHGFPHQPTALAYDPIQRLVAIGTKSGAIRILGRPGVSVQVRHEPVPDTTTSGGAGVGDRLAGGERGSIGGMSSSTGVNHHALSGPGGSAGGMGGGGGLAGNAERMSTGGNPMGNLPPGAGSASSGQASTTTAAAAAAAATTSHNGPAVLQLQFLVNEGGLVSATSDDILHLWNIRQKRPEIVHSLKFQRERITCFHLPFQSKWLYVGTEKGNVHVVNVETFTISGYVINWNKAIELSCKTHPGSVIHLSDCPTDPSKLLMGFESGLIVLWDLKTKAADSRFLGNESLRSVSWLSDGKQIISAHSDGSLATWNARTGGPRPPPVSVTYPHAKGGREGKPECKTIQKVEWKSSQSGEAYVIFSGGLPQDRPGRSASITVMHGRSTTVLEMEHNVVDFVTLCDTPWASETQDPHAIIVLLQNDLVIVDLLTPGFPCFENPYPMDIHESAVTCCLYIADCPGDLIPALYSVGAQGHSGFSKREWPISGGEWSSVAPSYAELIVTGHADGTVKFWDTSSLTLQVLYRLKTSKVFDKAQRSAVGAAAGSGASAANKGVRPDADSSMAGVMSEPGKQHLAVKQLAMCPDNRLLALAGASGHVILFKFRRQEANFETTVLDVPLFFESTEDPQGSPSFASVGASLEFCTRKEQPNPLSVRTGSYRRLPGFQVDLVCLSSWMDGEAPGSITALSVNSAYGLMAFGNEGGLVLVDIVQKSVLLSMASSDLYSSADPYTRLPRSPKRPGEGGNSRAAQSGDPSDEQSVRSSSCDQSRNGSCTSPTTSSSSGVGGRASSGYGSGMNSGGSGGGGGNSGASGGGSGGIVGGGSHSRSGGVYGEGGGGSSSASSGMAGTTSAAAATAGGVGGGVGGSGGVGGPMNVRSRPDCVRRSKSQDKSDNAFTRSRSSSTSSLENQTNEAVTTLTFADTLARKLDTAVSASLWVGTSQGSVLVIVINLAAPGEPRLTQPVMVSPSGSIFRIKGSMLCVAFMEPSGSLISNPSEPWRDETKETKESRSRTPTRPALTGFSSVGGAGGGSSGGGLAGPGSDSLITDNQYTVMVSEKQARVVSLPSHTCLYRINLAPADHTFIVTANVVNLKDGPCLATFSSNGHIQVFSLPSLRPLMDTEFCPLVDLSFQTSRHNLVDPMLNIWGQQQMFVNEDSDKIARNFRFSAHGHGVYLCSPSEIEKFTISSEFVSTLGDLMGELFLACEMPEPPKEGFFKGLFGGGVRPLDRDELFGEASTGKPIRGVARLIPGPSANLDALNYRAGSVAAEVAKTRMALTERGDKLSQLEDRTQRMANEAENFSQAAHQLMVRCRERKWYQL